MYRVIDTEFKKYARNSFCRGDGEGGLGRIPVGDDQWVSGSWILSAPSQPCVILGALSPLHPSDGNGEAQRAFSSTFNAAQPVSRDGHPICLPSSLAFA